MNKKDGDLKRNDRWPKSKEKLLFDTENKWKKKCVTNGLKKKKQHRTNQQKKMVILQHNKCMWPVVDYVIDNVFWCKWTISVILNEVCVRLICVSKIILLNKWRTLDR